MTPHRKEKLDFVLRNRQPDITVIMENIDDPHNIAAVMRSCDAVGIGELFVIRTKVPRRKRWGKKSSSGAKKWIRIYNFKDVETCFEAVRKKYSRIYATNLSKEAKSLYELDLTTSVALIFGNERTGVSEEASKLADGNFIIPQVGMISSLNISVACAVSVYEAYRQKNQAGHYGHLKLPEEEIQQLKKEWNMYGQGDAD